MRTLIIYFFLCLVTISTKAQEVDEELATKVAENHFNQILSDNTRQKRNKNYSPDATKMQKIKVEKIITKAFKNHPSYFIAKMEGGGFEVIAAHKSNGPVLMYSEDGIFDESNVPNFFWDWMAQYDTVIDYSFKKNSIDPLKIKKWINIEEDKFKISNLKSASYTPGVDYLIQTQWDQIWPYNSKVQAVGQSCGSEYHDNCPAGCGAIALGQIINYWGVTTGDFSSGHDANFEFWNIANSLDYYNVLPEQVNATAYMIEKLGDEFLNSIYCKDRGCKTYADFFDCIPVLQSMGYGSVSGHYCMFYSYYQWIALLISNLSIGLPILYAYSGSDYQHGFICDGYRSPYEFHFNLGLPNYWNIWCDYEDLRKDDFHFSNLNQHYCITGIYPNIPNDFTVDNNYTVESGYCSVGQVTNTFTIKRLTFSTGSKGQILAGNYVDLKNGFWAKQGSNVIIKPYLKSSMGGSYKSANLTELIDKNSESNLTMKKDFQFSIYPNPGSGEFHLDLKPISPSDKIGYKIFDITGKFITGNEFLSNKNIIDLRNFSKGIYVIKVYFNEELFIQKLVKQ